MEEILLYELNKESLGFLFRVRDTGNRTHLVHAKMKPYSNELVVQLLREQSGFMQQSKEDLDAWDVKGGSQVAGREFFDAHKIELKLNGKVLTDDQIEKLDARWDVKNAVIEHGYNGIHRVSFDAEAELEKEWDVEAILGDVAVKTSFLMTDDLEAEQTCLLNHRFEAMAAMDSLQWDRCSVQQGLRTGGFRVVYNHDLVNVLYTRKVSALEGATIEGAPCVKENKDLWVPKVPYLMKRAALNFLFMKAERAARGNA